MSAENETVAEVIDSHHPAETPAEAIDDALAWGEPTSDQDVTDAIDTASRLPADRPNHPRDDLTTKQVIRLRWSEVVQG